MPATTPPSAAETTLLLGLRDGPSLVHPPRGQAWWRASAADGGELRVWDGANTYAYEGDHVRISRGPRPAAWACAGRVYRDHELLFRHTAFGLRAIARMGARSRFVEGPEGAVLIGDRSRYVRGCGPKGDAQPLEAPVFEGAWGLRWSADGRTVACVDDAGEARYVDLVTGRVVRRTPGVLPIDADPDGEVLREDGPIREATAVLDGTLLSGPGGVIWDLATGTRRFETPVIPLGTVLPGPTRWRVRAWDQEAWHLVDPLTGHVHEDEHEDEDDHEDVDTTVQHGPRPDLDLPFTSWTTVGSRTWAWNDDGLLLALPAGPQPL